MSSFCFRGEERKSLEHEDHEAHEDEEEKKEDLQKQKTLEREALRTRCFKIARLLFFAFFVCFVFFVFFVFQAFAFYSPPENANGRPKAPVANQYAGRFIRR